MEVSVELLRQIILDQREVEILPEQYIARAQEQDLQRLEQNPEIIVVTGLRRCGKSVLLRKLRSAMPQIDYAFNFEDDRLVNFTVNDFQHLLESFITLFGDQQHFFFDEIQNIPGWEMFVRRLYNSGKKIYLTGSNANLFSEELGTRLTGRYIEVNVYPLSFFEYAVYKFPDTLHTKKLSTKQVALLKSIFFDYLNLGGIPAYTIYKDVDYLHTLYESILYKDIVARYKIPDAEPIKKLLYYLASNCGKELTYRSLRGVLGIGSTTTISKYCSYIENSCLCFFVELYDDSLKIQQRAPKKVYFVDHILAKTVGFRISEDYGRMLENIVFLELKRRSFNVYYYKDKHECDFVLRNNISTLAVIQVCHDLSDTKTKQREMQGLLEAMHRFSLISGTIITLDAERVESVTIDGTKYTVNIVPIWKWLINYYDNSEN